jgi:hypothetical protein
VHTETALLGYAMVDSLEPMHSTEILVTRNIDAFLTLAHHILMKQTLYVVEELSEIVDL